MKQLRYTWGLHNVYSYSGYIMKTKTKFKIKDKLPEFIAKFLKFTTTIAGTKHTVTQGRAVNLFSYITERIETYSYYDVDTFRFAEVILTDFRRAGRMMAIANDNQIVFVQPFINSIAFLNKPWDEVTIKDVLDLVWVELDQSDIELLDIEYHNFEAKDFEDFISQNKNLTAENLGFLFLKYSV